MNATTNGPRVTAALAAFVAGAQASDIPSGARRAGCRALVNIVGCCLGGARHDTVVRASRALLPQAGLGIAGLLGRSERADVLNASFINALASGAYSFDDTHARASLHPSGAIATALLALAEQEHLTGEALLVAFILGVDVAARISKAVSVAPAVGNVAWSQTGIAAGIGTAAAAARALGLDSVGVLSAIGIAALQAGGFRAAHGSMAVTLIFGHAAQVGLRAALLARAGLTGPVAPIEGTYGFLSVFSDRAHLPYLSEELGTTFEVEALASKAYPCGAVIHPAVEAALSWQRFHGDSVGKIEQVGLRVHPLALALGARRHPVDVSEAKVSLYHWVAAALVRGRAGIAEGAQQVIDDPRVVRLRAATDVQQDSRLGPESAELNIRLSSGEKHAATVVNVKGGAASPMSDADLDEKFRGQGEMVLPPERVSKLLSACWAVESLDNAATIARLAQTA